jgi:fructose-specific phosphotransferase system IIA component
MRITEILDIKCVKVPLAAQEKFQAITELVDLLDARGLLDDYDAVLKAVMEREAIRSTGIGQGFAIPHGKCNAVSKLVMALGKVSKPIDFESIDQHPVSVIVLLVSPTDQTGPHIQALARISRLMTDRDFRDKIWSAESADRLYKLIQDHESE